MNTISGGVLNILEFGAKGDGVADDTAAIQAALDQTAKRGGGKIFFPYTKGGYRIDAGALAVAYATVFRALSE